MSSATRVESALSSYPLIKGARDPSVENLAFPPMVPIFLALCDRRAWKPPTQDQFARAVAAKVSTLIVSGGRSLLGPVIGRSYRAYISLVVQYHALAVLNDHYALAIWDGLVDMRQKIDVLAVTDDGMSVGLELMCPTDTSLERAARKAEHAPVVPIAVRRLIVSERDYVAGSYWLYRPQILIDAVEDGAAEQRIRIARRYFDEGYSAARSDLERTL